eukprot:1912908-Prymnesium_polylepis.3
MRREVSRDTHRGVGVRGRHELPYELLRGAIARYRHAIDRADGRTAIAGGMHAPGLHRRGKVTHTDEHLGRVNKSCGLVVLPLVRLCVTPRVRLALQPARRWRRDVAVHEFIPRQHNLHHTGRHSLQRSSHAERARRIRAATLRSRGR